MKEKKEINQHKFRIIPMKRASAKAEAHIKSRSHNGFSLVEVLVAVFIFSLLMITMTFTYGRFFATQKKTRSIQQNAEDARFTMELMAKSLRTSVLVGCNGGTCVQNVSYPSVEVYDFSQSKCIRYYFASLEGKIKSVSASTTLAGCNSAAVPISASDYVLLNNFVGEGFFTVFPAESGMAGKIAITAKICSNQGCTGANNDIINLQTSVSLRNINLPPAGGGGGGTDITPPENITDLSSTGATGSSVSLSWTAPGDDIDVGTAMLYDIRYSTTAITEANFNSAPQAVGAPTPAPHSSPQTFDVTGLNASTTYYFAIKTADEALNWSLISTPFSQATGAVTGCTSGGDISSNLTGYWKLNESSGSTAADSSNYNPSDPNSGTLYNMESSDWTTSGSRRGLLFDGVGGASGEYVRTAANNRYDSYQSGTIVAWFKTTSQTTQALFSYSTVENASSVMEWGVYSDAGTPKLYQDWKTPNGTWAGLSKAAPNIFDGNWHMAAFVAPGGASAVKMYLDGTDLGTVDLWQETPPYGLPSDFFADVISTANQFAEIGARHRDVTNVGVDFFNGNISEVRIYSRPLSGPEICQLYNLPPAPAPAATGLAAHWKLDDGLGAEKIPNGNFGGDVNGWQKTGLSTLSWQNAASGDGSTGYMRFNINGNVDYDRFATSNSPSVTAASTTYAVSFWYRTSGITGNLQAYSGSDIYALGTTASWASDEITPSTAWRYYSTTITTDASDYPLFGISKLGSIGSGTLDIDAISVKTTASSTLTAVDSADGHTGSLANGPTWTAGKIGGGLNMDGTNDYVGVGTVDFGNVFTISAWVNINSGESSIQTIMANAGSGAATNGLRIFVNTYGTSDQKLWIETGNGSTGGEATSAAGIVPYSGWHHVVAIVDRANGLANAYVDNVKVITNDGIRTDFANNQTTNIGQMTNNTYQFGGKMDDVRVYNGSLSASEVAELYAVGAPSAPSVPSATLIGHWALDDGTGGYANDSSVNNKDATLSGPSWTLGKLDGALDFDGTNDYTYIPGSIEIYNADPGETKTFSAWFRAGTQSAENSILWNEGGCLGWEINLNTSGDVRFYLRTGPSDCTGYTSYEVSTSGTNYADNQWHLVTGVIDRPNNTIELYVDGISQGTDTIDTNGAPGDYMRFGTNWDNSAPFDGSIDDVRVYNGALSGAEVQALYGESNATLVGHWKLDDGSGLTASDSSGNNNNGTLTGGPTWTTGKVGGGLNFDGTDDYVGLPGVTTGTTFTYSAWIKPNSQTEDYGTIFAEGTNLGFWYRGSSAGANAGKMTFYYGSADHHNTTALSDGQWNHFVASVNASNVTFYLNGIANGTAAGATSLTADRMGDDSGSETYKGSLDDVRVYNGALSGAEVQALYNASVPSNNITVRARGTNTTNPHEQIELSVDGSPLSTWTLTDTYQDYTASATVSSSSTLSIDFANDIGDVQVDYIIVDGTTYQAENQAVNTGAWNSGVNWSPNGNGACGGVQGDSLGCNGYIEFPMGTTAPVSDNFNTGFASNWTQQYGDSGTVVSSGTQIAAQSTSDAYAYWNAGTFYNNQFSEATLTNVNGSDDSGVTVRASSSNMTFYRFVWWPNDSTWHLVKAVNNVWTDLDSFGPSHSGYYAAWAGAKIKISAVGNVITGYVDGWSVVQAVDNSITGGRPGVFLGDINTYLDDWSAGNLGLSLSASDNFNRSGPALGSNWTQTGTDAFSIASSTVARPSATSEQAARWNARTFSPDQYAQARVTQVGSSGQQLGVAVRAQNDGSRNYYNLYFDSGNLFFGKAVNGAWSQFQSFAAPLVGDVLKLVAVGNQISAYKNGAPLSTVTDNSFPSGSPGLAGYYSSSLVTIDDWEGGDLSTKVAVGADNFDRTNANPVGGNWQTLTGRGNMQIISNQLTGQTSTGCGAFYAGGTFSGDQYSQAKLGVINNHSGVLVRASSTSDTGYLFYQDQGYQTYYRLRRMDSGVATELHNYTTVNAQAGDVIRLEVLGNQLTPYVNGVRLEPVWDYNLTSGRPGLRDYGSVIRFDDWVGGNL